MRLSSSGLEDFQEWKNGVMYKRYILRVIRKRGGLGTKSTNKQIDGIGWKVQKQRRAVYLIDMVD